MEAVHEWRGGLTSPAPFLRKSDTTDDRNGQSRKGRSSAPSHVTCAPAGEASAPHDGEGAPSEQAARPTNYLFRMASDLDDLEHVSPQVGRLLHAAPTRIEPKRLWCVRQATDLEAVAERRHRQLMAKHHSDKPLDGSGADGLELRWVPLKLMELQQVAGDAPGLIEPVAPNDEALHLALAPL